MNLKKKFDNYILSGKTILICGAKNTVKEEKSLPSTRGKKVSSEFGMIEDKLKTYFYHISL